MKIFIISFFTLGLIYLLWPGPSSVTDFNQLPQSLKSSDPEDSIGHFQGLAFFSHIYRDQTMAFYEKEYKRLNHFLFGPIRINYPPEFAYFAIKNRTLSTYLEELVYPMRSSLFVNGFEPFSADGQSKFRGATVMIANDSTYATKTTVRFYPSNVLNRIIVWIGTTISLYLLIIFGRKIINE